MKRNGHTVILAGKIEKKIKYKKRTTVEAISKPCEDKRCYACFKNRCTCDCHSIERQEMLYP